ncbi:MFS transporter [Parasediminibacterium paludis]|uniref:MFS transporter n=1 Tax=Parasediminibacterium paludis TaxID=908966 RepID=A0ABV8PXB1_9BACT
MKTNRWNHTFRAFRSRNYTLFFCGQSLSLIGTWMQRTAVSWLIYSLTHSALMLGLSIFASQFPSLVFSLLGGIVSDRYHRYKILLITQTASMLQAVLLAVLTLTNHAAVWQILALSVLLGIINSFDVPARQPLIHELVSNKEDVPNALALNFSMVNIARLVGPALSGIVLGSFGAGICFLLNAVSFVAVILSLLLIKLPPYQKKVVQTNMQSQFVEGINYLKKTPQIAVVIVLISLVSLLVLPYDTLLPVFAKVVFNGGATTFGFISSFIGLGAIVATLFLASFKQTSKSQQKALWVNITLLGVGLILFSHIAYFPIAMLFAALSGFGGMSQNTICLTIIQMHTDEVMRGRVMSYVAMAYFGMLPLGSLIIGAVSQKIGADNTMLGQGIIALVIAGMLYWYLQQTRNQQQPTTTEMMV